MPSQRGQQTLRDCPTADGPGSGLRARGGETRDRTRRRRAETLWAPADDQDCLRAREAWVEMENDDVELADRRSP